MAGKRKTRFEVYRDKAGEFRWRLVSSNGKTVADSGEGYKTKRSALGGLEAVRVGAAGAELIDLTKEAKAEK